MSLQKDWDGQGLGLLIRKKKVAGETRERTAYFRRVESSTLRENEGSHLSDCHRAYCSEKCLAGSKRRISDLRGGTYHKIIQEGTSSGKFHWGACGSSKWEKDAHTDGYKMGMSFTT